MWLGAERSHCRNLAVRAWQEIVSQGDLVTRMGQNLAENRTWSNARAVGWIDCWKKCIWANHEYILVVKIKKKEHIGSFATKL
jgi:hypothetical protein